MEYEVVYYMKEEVKRWLQLAKDDLNSAQANFSTGQYYVCAFLCQQSVEKGLKALLIKNTGKLIKTHDTVLLGKKLNMPEHLLDACTRLNAVYMDARYGDTGGMLPSEKFTKEVSMRFLENAREACSWVGKNI